MKLRETRILKQTKVNGAEVYFPQYKTLYLGIPCWEFFASLELPEEMTREFFNTMPKLRYNQSNTLEESKEIIDQYISYVNWHNASTVEGKVVKSEYIKYPVESFDFNRFHRQLNYSMIGLILLVICIFLLAGCNPNIQLDRNEWVCTVGGGNHTFIMED